VRGSNFTTKAAPKGEFGRIFSKAAYRAKIHRFPGDVRHAKNTVCARAHSYRKARQAGGLFKTIALRASGRAFPVSLTYN